MKWHKIFFFFPLKYKYSKVNWFWNIEILILCDIVDANESQIINDNLHEFKKYPEIKKKTDTRKLWWRKINLMNNSLESVKTKKEYLYD